MAIAISQYIAFPLVFLYFVYYFNNMIKQIHYSSEVIWKIVVFFIGMLLIMVGYFLISDAIVFKHGLPIRIFGDCVTIVGIRVFFYSLTSIPDLSEFDWQKKIRALLIIHQDGICLFSRFWKRASEDFQDDNMISAALSSIDSILKSMIGKQKLSSVQLEDKNFIFEYRKKAIFVLIADEVMESLQARLKKFASDFYELYKAQLETFLGQMSFGMADWLADKLFYPEKKQL
jgi:hypothetical protein